MFHTTLHSQRPTGYIIQRPCVHSSVAGGDESKPSLHFSGANCIGQCCAAAVQCSDMQWRGSSRVQRQQHTAVQQQQGVGSGIVTKPGAARETLGLSTPPPPSLLQQDS